MGRRRRGDDEIRQELDRLTQSGMSAAVVEHRRKLLGGGDIWIWEENVPALQVFLRCQPSAIQTLRPVGLTVVSGMWWMGISAQEVESALRVSGIPRQQWAGLADDVLAMSAAWARERNAASAPVVPENAAKERPTARR